MKMGRWHSRLYKTDRARDFEHERDRNVRARQIYETIDRQGYQWVVVLVAGIGFFLDGYTLFASNTALPMIAYVYWNDKVSSRPSTWINIATLAGTLLGQVVFGVLADQKGRKRMYGLELILLIASTLGVVMCSSGADQSMSVFGWLIWWRLVVGIGVGADYPLSAVITAEFAPTRHRARMMASVFFMQPLGQISGNIVSIIVIAITQKTSGDANLTRSVDIMWRWVIGLGVVPGVLAVLFRLAIPETPRFLLDIEDDPVKAEFDTTFLFGENELELETGSSVDERPTASAAGSNRSRLNSTTSGSAEYTMSEAPLISLNSKWSISRADIHQYFWEEGNWRTIFAVSFCWLLLDFGFYGIGLSNPQFIAKVWGDLNISNPQPQWKISEDPSVSVYDMFFRTSVHSLVILNLGSFIGGSLLILTINRLDRVYLQKYSFLVLAAIFIAMGTMFMTVHREGAPAIVLYVLAQIAFNFGPNVTTYMIPAELFPTRYRASCHGIAAASGKLGSILVQIFGTYYRTGSSTPGDNQTVRYGRILIVFSAVMIVGAIVTHFWIPRVQYSAHERRPGDHRFRFKNIIERKPSKPLEVLALGRKGEMSQSVIRSRISRWGET